MGWYYIPVEKGEATWMEPYYNQNINVLMVSYVTPLYKDGELIGVVGMDIDYSVIIDKVKEMKAYETGYAFLIDQNNTIIYHEQYPQGTPLEELDSSIASVTGKFLQENSSEGLISYQLEDVDKSMVVRRLKNGMNLILVAPMTEINEHQNKLLIHVIIAGISICVLFCALAVIISRRIVRPLQELNTAAQKIAAGDLSIDLTRETSDEVGTLTESFQMTVSHLQNYIDEINSLAYKDALTGVKNKMAYQDYANRLDDDISRGKAQFGVVVFDVNNLKKCKHDYLLDI